MTFILNVLHKDFSILAGDKQAGTSGSAEFKIGSSTICVNSPNITINGVKKLFTNKSNTLVAGMAGVIDAHSYTHDLEQSDGPANGLAIIHQHVNRFYLEADRAPIYGGARTNENQALACYYDEPTKRFTTNLLKFSPLYSQSWLYHSTEAGLLHIGTGSVALESAVGKESIQAFIASILSESNPSACLAWIRDTFERVSEHAEGCGRDFTAYAATRREPVFSQIAS